MIKNNIFGKRIILAVAALSLTSYVVSVGANDEFKQWMQEQSSGVEAEKKEFQEYKDKRDKEFTDFLKSHWTAVDIVKGEIRDEEPKPVVMPVAPKKPQPKIVVNKPVAKPVVRPVKVFIPKPDVSKSQKPIPVVVVPKGNSLNVNFYGRQIRFNYDARLKQSLARTINTNAVSNYWSALSKTEYEDLLQQLAAQQKSLRLNDWAFASLINSVAVKVNNKRNESALLSWFLLAKSGYKARIAYSANSIYLLVPSKHEMFEVSFFTFSGTRYYAVSFDGNKQKLGQVFTYDGEYPNTTKYFDMQVTPAVASSDQSERRHLSFVFEGKKYNIDVTYDRGRIKFLRSYPQLNLNLYFSSGVYPVTATPLQKQLAAHMTTMTEQQAVNFLLRFVQTSLQYETDDQQFGEENYLFPEETLFYPYSDCEDRAVLFAWLVKSLLNLDVVGLDYPGHVAAAVHFNEAVSGDSINYKGKRYVVTDPTYINASAGMTMPDFKQSTPSVINY